MSALCWRSLSARTLGGRKIGVEDAHFASDAQARNDPDIQPKTKSEYRIVFRGAIQIWLIPNRRVPFAKMRQSDPNRREW